MNVPNASFNFSANTVPTILTLGGFFALLIHFLTPANEFINTTPLAWLGGIMLIVGIILFILVNA